ncbi:tyrosine-type recombinase/integrase [Tuwongella immobilis]|uniref:Tyr recombinase domain-containing protein n=1 Tax=Tuwongella immobilis TaxID=692036 RepID=A0A6C2YUQ7_9BACT|nr:site-specific integrase [Tuwongella immobilis]VIP05350.1 phage integrase family protein : Phage-related integrase OS=Rhodopirellula baltica SWK14 GN=RBSWK_01414 PE=4 SV=1: Phage_integrase [Tuwongella immobilis]VTS08056.1 phage integrase family protein : Phage-related integrase OS=Rhodopirellula baltica SWK14 GN=RBSWK_01414 PE=4 SV=1: Phage_integrase [Tuwongella immobilis]
MAHQPKPFFRTARNAWYIQLDGQQIKLAPGPKNSTTEKAAWSQFHEIVAQRKISLRSNTAQPSDNSAALSVAHLCDKYLDWCKTHRASRTYDGYLWHLQRFIESLPDAISLPATSLRPYHIVEWIDKYPDWGQTYRRNAIAAIKRVYAWGEELGYIESNPIRKIRKPSPARREQVITPDDWIKIRDHYPEGDPFRDVLEFAWETGCRPMEIKRIEARHVDLPRHRVVFPPAESKGKRKARVIYLTARAEAALSRRLVATPTGILFKNADGLPWTASAMSCRFARLKKSLGVKYAAYSFRHSFAQRLLVSGVDHLTVAELLGHCDGTMIAKTYQHLAESSEHLMRTLNEANANQSM